ncbi:MAG TPA: UvrD-helicase domain-containing protein [Planctomycetaceae bacterium]|nr:UvrD-helicase domain-containing protein [Planctomycetaceae bacterium]
MADLSLSAPRGSATAAGGHLSGLNPSQKDAVLTLAGPLLVLAGAGTGKTRVITYRMAELIRTGTQPDRILSVTFTNKAAKEMQERMSSLLGGKRQRSRPVVSTFHSLCVKILRQEITALGYPGTFLIYDRGDQESAARKALRDIRVPDTSLRPGDLLAQISKWKTLGVGPEDARDFIEDDRGMLAAAGYRKYQASLRAAGAVDFDDLLMLTDLLFHEFPDVLGRQQQRFDHVQIDEYQDTNEMQFRIIRDLVLPHGNLCVVGDDDQSIYGWRGAEVKHILGFQQHFPGAKVVRLQDNYRCTRQILDLANSLVKHNRGRHEKTLVAHKDGVEVLVRPYADEQTEAEGVVREINYLTKQLNIPPGDIAILFRTNEQPRLFEQELRRLNIPYTLVGGQSFFDRREVRDMMAYLKAIAHPEDEVSLLRIINTPARGIGDTAVEKVLTRAVKSGQKFWAAVPDAVAAKEITVKTAKAMEEFHHLLARFRSQLQTPGQKISTLLRELVDVIDYESEIEKQYKEKHQQLARSGTIDECIEALEQYEERTHQPTLSQFLEQTTLEEREENFGNDDKQLDRPAAKLMTLHSAKGLEFPRVFLVGLEEGILPHKRSVDAEGDDPNAIEEERRLAYVGVTRAKDYLTLTRAETRTSYGKRKLTKVSRFLREMFDLDSEEEAALLGK